MNFWNNVKSKIREANTTQEWVASHCDIDFGTFRGWIARHRLPRADAAVKIAAALGTTVEYLITGLKPDDHKNRFDRPPDESGTNASVNTDNYTPYKQLIADLNVLDDKVVAGFLSAINAVAEEARREKRRQGGSAAS